MAAGEAAAAVVVGVAVVLVAEAVAAVVAVVANYDTVNLSNSTGLASDPRETAERQTGADRKSDGPYID